MWLVCEVITHGIINFAFMNEVMRMLKQWLAGLSFRTGVIVLSCCIPFYVLSAVQFLLPIEAGWKGVLWVVFFGLAKTAQYGGLAILGVDGYRRLKAKMPRLFKKRCLEDD